ncbi:MAG: hypothetical protein QXM68_00800 [Candidatus Aenigmatarchaeota archaeon]|nr:hypothetical protein [Candidatus Aenigmarchaeota archaeon]
MSEILLVYDIPKTRNSLLVRIWRRLKKMNASKIMDSTWSIEDNDINFIVVKEIMNEIINAGGRAIIIRGEIFE